MESTNTEESVKLGFGKAVRSARKELGLSQEALGEFAELHRTYITDIERGERNPSLLVMVRIANALGKSLSSLVEFQNRLGDSQDSICDKSI